MINKDDISKALYEGYWETQQDISAYVVKPIDFDKAIHSFMLMNIEFIDICKEELSSYGMFFGDKFIACLVFEKGTTQVKRKYVPSTLSQESENWFIEQSREQERKKNER